MNRLQRTALRIHFRKIKKYPPCIGTWVGNQDQYEKLRAEGLLNYGILYCVIGNPPKEVRI